MTLEREIGASFATYLEAFAQGAIADREMAALTARQTPASSG